ncbi:Yip1 family protein [Thauera sinica]|uniref:Yip1 family protein n=1 Tax=Thauera sinica TaxID=2665146 RepID=A0ABW1AWL3_9RHOO|nr:Yip1 family protein [Thauera sp. K11]ATE62548.1 YIP1 family protein [Thauera sp. K11]
MTLHDLPKMFYSYSEGWSELRRIHPAMGWLFVLYVMPLSLLPPAMVTYSMEVSPGAVFPQLVPALSGGEAFAVAAAFYVAQLLMVLLMASIIQDMGELVDATPSHHDAFMLAAVAPTPLWLSSLALFVPSAWIVGTIVAAAWLASAALIFHGVCPLFGITDHGKGRLMGYFVLALGVVAWLALLVVLALILSIIVGLR